MCHFTRYIVMGVYLTWNTCPFRAQDRHVPFVYLFIYFCAVCIFIYLSSCLLHIYLFILICSAQGLLLQESEKYKYTNVHQYTHKYPLNYIQTLRNFTLFFNGFTPPHLRGAFKYSSVSKAKRKPFDENNYALLGTISLFLPRVRFFELKKTALTKGIFWHQKWSGKQRSSRVSTATF